jgi:outer membrane scaffolding protein for murein synthesis (MipA/OmpV family)
MYFKPGDSDSEQMRRLDKRKSTVMAGLSYVHNTPYGFLRTRLQAIRWITATVSTGISPGCTATPTVT